MKIQMIMDFHVGSLCTHMPLQPNSAKYIDQKEEQGIKHRITAAKSCLVSLEKLLLHDRAEYQLQFYKFYVLSVYMYLCETCMTIETLHCLQEDLRVLFWVVSIKFGCCFINVCALNHRHRLREQPGHVSPPNNWESPMHLSLFDTFFPQYFGLPIQYLLVGATPPPIICRRVAEAMLVCLFALLHFHALHDFVLNFWITAK